MGLTGNVFSFGAQLGSPRAAEATDAHIDELRDLLRAALEPPYAKDVDEFAFVARVDGEIWQFGSEGVEQVRRNKKGRYIGADICIPEQRWQAPVKEFRRYLADQVRIAFEACIARLRKQKVPIEGERLMADVERACQEFLARTPGHTE